MTTTPLGSSSTSSNTTAPTPQLTANNSLTPQDFIQMMVTQLQNQDPLQPTSNEDLLNQMSEIGQLQSSTDLSTTLKTITLQNDISSAGNMIGKQVTGQDDRGNPMQGVVDSVKVVDGAVSLELDNGQELSLSNVTGITAMNPTTGTPTSPTSTTPTPIGA
jgi:flagellar basal-body rod modification protein FlgD